MACSAGGPRNLVWIDRKKNILKLSQVWLLSSLHLQLQQLQGFWGLSRLRLTDSACHA